LTYTVKEIFYTLQGEGAQTGRAAVFCRFSGCNLWSGREEDRSRAVCKFCDTDFVGTGPDGGRFRSAKELADAIDRCWAGEGHNADEDDPSRRSAGLPKKYVVCTGGEPLLQVDETLISELHQRGFEVAVETNGTRPAPRSLDWVCVSPKAGAPLVQTTGSELKLVYPQENPEHRARDRVLSAPSALAPEHPDAQARRTEIEASPLRSQRGPQCARALTPRRPLLHLAVERVEILDAGAGVE